MRRLLERDLTRQIDILDEKSAPRIIHSGEDILVEHLPAGTRVIYPNPPMRPLANPRAAIRYALNHPIDSDPLHALLRPGMKLTIAMDDISLPLPMMKTPDIRQLMLEAVLEMAADYGVDDIELIIAVSLHRHMHDFEVKRMVGEKIFNAYWPDKLYNHDAEDRENIVSLGFTEHPDPSIASDGRSEPGGEEVPHRREEVALNRRAVESDLLVYLNINLVPMDGGNKSVSVGLASYESVRAHHNSATMVKCHSYMDPKSSALADSVDRMGKLTLSALKIFQVETCLNNDYFGDSPLAFLGKREDELTRLERAALDATVWSLKKMPREAKRRMFHAMPANYGLVAVNAGETNAVHQRTLDVNFGQYNVQVKGQADVLVCGVPFISPYNANSILNPILVQVMGLGYFFNMYRGKPLLKKGGVLILTHPMPDAFNATHHPSYIEFFHRLLPETTDSATLEKRYEEEFARNPTYIEMYRHGNAYHPVHPFYMWYWGEAGRQHVGKVIAVGTDDDFVPRTLGWASAPDLTTALDMARDYTSPNPQITMMHHPPIVIAEME